MKSPARPHPRSHLRRTIGLLLAVLLLGLALPALGAEPGAFTIEDRLGHTWTNEVVTFPLSEAQSEKAEAGAALLGLGDRSVTYQIVGRGSGKPRIALQVNLEPWQKNAFRFGEGNRARKTDLKIERSEKLLRITNSRIGISLRRSPAAGEGPIEAIRLGSETWTGGSTLKDGAAVKDCALEVKAAGPIYAEASYRVEFEDGGRWELTFRIERNEPVVLVREEFDAPGGGTFTLALGGKSFRPTNLLYRGGAGGTLGTVTGGGVPEQGGIFLLEPWLHWWGNPKKGNWFALYRRTPPSAGKALETLDGGDDGVGGMLDEVSEDEGGADDPQPDMLMVGVLRPAVWKDPDWEGKAKPAAPRVHAGAREGIVTLPFPLRGGRREWLLGTPAKKPSIEVLMAKKKHISPLPQHYVIKHGDFPLDEVKDYILEWEGEQEDHPRLFVRKEDLPALRERLEISPKEIQRWRGSPVSKYNIEGPIRVYLGTNDPKVAQHMVRAGDQMLQGCVNMYLEQDSLVTPGMAPHHQTIINSTVNLLDPVIASEHVTPEMRRRMLARIAFLGYVVNSPNYWSPRRGFRANPNMTTTVACYQTAVACMISSHPKARAWAQNGLKELYDRQLKGWSDPDGGWLEAPHYAMVSYDHMLGSFLMAANAGFADYVYDERMRKVIEWFAKISTPPDPHTEGNRHLPPIGNTYIGEPTGMFGIVAGIWKDRAPEFAAEMQWMYRQHGSFTGSGIGGFCPTIAGYRSLLKDPSIEPRNPQYGSELFRRTGVVLRNTLGSERESYLHMIAGSNHAHYDYDSGSIVLWGKGRLLANDFGYIGRHPARWHSMLTSGAARGNMYVRAFAPSDALDYVLGKKGAWQRQIAFAKDTAPTGPNFFLIRDTHGARTKATWRLWLTAEAVQINKHGATLRGRDDVDMDCFFYRAGDLALKTEETAQECICGNRDGRVGPVTTEQTAIVASLSAPGALTALLYPRLENERPPKVTWLADGRGVKVVSPAGTDYVFLATKSFKYEGGDVSFEGTAGAARIREDSVVLTLGAGGRIAAGGSNLESKKPASREGKP